MTLSWSVPFFPKTGGYNIYHMKNNKSKSIVQFSNNLPMLNQSKYRYLSRPYNSTCISFEIMDITLDDAGYYASGTIATDAWSKGRAVVLIVFGEFLLKLFYPHFFLDFRSSFFSSNTFFFSKELSSFIFLLKNSLI